MEFRRIQGRCERGHALTSASNLCHNWDVLHSIPQGLLVASPSLNCPFFGRSVVLMIDHDENGSFGLALTKPSVLRFSRLREELGLEGRREFPVLYGGPVETYSGWFLFERDPDEELDDDTIAIGDKLACSASIQLIERFDLEAPSSRRALFFLGYSGWGAGQLEAEFKEGSWIPADLDPDLIFNHEPDERWRAALDSLGIDPAFFISHGGPAS